MLIVLLVSTTFLTTVIVAQTLKDNHITGVIFNSSKQPVASVWVILSQKNQQLAQSLTGDDGKYYIGNLVKGNYDLEVKRGDKSLLTREVSLPKDTVNNIQLP